MKNNLGIRMRPSSIKLEQRFIFDGGVAADVAQAVSAISTPNAALAIDSTNGVSSAYAMDAITKYAELIAPTTLADGNRLSYRVTKNGVVGDWQATYAAPPSDGSQDGSYRAEVKQIDQDGNESAVEIIDFILQSTCPDAPDVGLVNALTGGMDRGYNTDLVSPDALLVSPSNVDDGNLLEYRVTYGDHDTGWQTSYQAPPGDGSVDGVYSIQVRQTDAAGNVSDVESIDFTLDSGLAIFSPPDQMPTPNVATPLELLGGQVITQHANEIFFVDTTVAAYQTLVNDARSNIDIYLLDPSQDPWSQMTEVISHYQNVSAIHLASHGTAGEILIGDRAYGLTQIDAMSS